MVITAKAARGLAQRLERAEALVTDGAELTVRLDRQGIRVGSVGV